MSQAGIIGINTSSGIVVTLTGNSGGPVPPTGGNINIVGSGTITVAGNPGTSTLTISTSGAVASSFPTDSGTAVPSAGALTIKAGISSINCGASVQFTGSGSTVELNVTTLGISHNTLIGLNCGQFLSTGLHNTGLGYGALNSSPAGLSGSYNCALGEEAGFDITTGTGNIAVGAFALSGGDPANYNIAIGFQAATNYTIGEDSNIVIGNLGVSLDANTIRIGTTGSGSQQQNKCFIAGIDAVDLSTANVVTEVSDQLGTTVLTAGAGISITPGVGILTIASTASGGVTSITGNAGAAQTGAISLVTASGTPIFAGAAGTITLDFGLSNLLLGSSGSSINLATATTALGLGALASVTDGGANTAVGTAALTSCDVGSGNSGFGFQPLATLTSGSNNTAIGTVCMNSLQTGSDNVGVGAALSGLLTGSSNLAIGNNAGAAYNGAESENIVIGNTGVLGESNTIRIGTTGGFGTNQTSCYIAAIDGVNVGSTAKVVTMGTAGTADQLGTADITAGTGISVSSGANTITISATGTTTLTVTSVNNAASPYTVLSTDEFLAVNTSGGAVTIRLPNAPATGRVYYIKDSNGTAAASNITVTTVGGAVNIDGATSFVMNTAYESISVIFTGSAYEVF